MWKRVIAPTALVSALWIAVSVPTTYYINWLFDSLSQRMSENVTTIEAAWAMRRDAWRLQVAVMEAMQADAREPGVEIKQIETSFQNSLTAARQNSQTAAEQAAVELISLRFAAYRDQIQAQLANYVVRGPVVPSVEDRDETRRLGIAVTEACRELLAANEAQALLEKAENERQFQRIVTARWGFLVIAPAVGLLLGWWVARRLNRSISQISVNLRDVTGNLGAEIGSVAVSMSDDLPALQRQVQRVADRIRTVVSELEQTRQRVLQAERLAAVGELAAGVAHEVRNPLTSVKLLIQTAAQRQPSQPLSARQLEIVLQEISRIETMIQGLLDFARPPRLRIVCHDLLQTLRRALNLAQGRAEQEGVSIVEEFPDHPVMIHADPEQLHLVFNNLAINAVEAMHRGGTLRISVTEADGKCRVVFADNGSGIPKQILDRLFEPFVSSKERGTGLGLAISRRVMQEHGGSLTAANRPEGGAAFTVELRADAASAMPGVQSSVSANEQTPVPV